MWFKKNIVCGPDIFLLIYNKMSHVYIAAVNASKIFYRVNRNV